MLLVCQATGIRWLTHKLRQPAVFNFDNLLALALVNYRDERQGTAHRGTVKVNTKKRGEV